jgi:pyruvate kinase
MASDRRRTKIVATIGPATSTRDALRELVDAVFVALGVTLSH